jgi:hypothetical protein
MVNYDTNSAPQLQRASDGDATHTDLAAPRATRAERASLPAPAQRLCFTELDLRSPTVDMSL